MGWKEINFERYAAEIRMGMNTSVSDEIIKKDLLLTLILAEMEKRNLGRELIFKGGTLLSRNYLKYHRFSEDLDFVHKDSNSLRELARRTREGKIRKFIDSFVPKLKEVADALDLEFSLDRSNTKFCTILHGRTVYTFRLYYSGMQYIKVEINFVEKMINAPKEVSIKAITDFFDSKEIMFALNLSYENFNVQSYSLDEIILEKYRAILTRKSLQERDIFDLFLIKGSLKADPKDIIQKIKSSSLIKRELSSLVQEKLKLLQEGTFFKSEEKIEELAVFEYDKAKFEEFKKNIEPILISICGEFLKTC
jgi:predicted nucleotidyltransferase component of viral defense system